MGVGWRLVKLRQFDRAAKVFQRALALNPDDARERRLLASIQLMAHQPQDALATLQPLLVRIRKKQAPWN